MNELDDDMLDEGPLECDLEEFGDDWPKTSLCPDCGRYVMICTRGSIAFPNVDQPDRVKSVVSSIVRGLNSAHAPTVRPRGDVIEFKGCMFRAVFNWSPLAIITKGRVSVRLEPGNVKVDYCLWYTGLFVLATVPSCLIGVCALASMSIAALAVAIAAFAVLFGLNRLISKLLFRAYLMDCTVESESSASMKKRTFG